MSKKENTQTVPCPGCHQALSVQQVKLLREVRRLVRGFCPPILSETDEDIEVLVRFDGEIICRLSPDLFHAVGFSDLKS